ncbi:putative secreted protein (Por secretion system target) [Kordia periserrulae]|uniref:Putative secreted protein (Por secretion system target) n=1 Tax=Kordia periserrulae TaxID=701523 RepID=A0A2T6C417_9FLAO|nr:endonuclease [Kordia periserrulae]PTX63070.1 putative secreted protein (Por secretion system target) [Kordia periserrulae]
MKKLLLWLFLVVSFTSYAQIPAYYNDVNLSQSGTNLKDELATKIISTHTTFLSYTPGVWNALQQSDLDLTNSSNVLLIYGHNDTDGSVVNDRTRDKFQNGGSVGDWNREHVFAKSLANPDLGTSGPGADAHNLRACDFQQNSTRNNRKFGVGTGIAAYINPTGDWYPGDEWKGDVARIIMFMYLRYGNQCLPANVGTGTPLSVDNNMIDLFLQWNVDDPVSAFEENRNEVLAGIQGNRNPFIDNPAFATQIWGGPQAEDKFNVGNDTEAPTVPQNLTASNITTTAATLSWTASTDNVSVASYEVFRNGVFIGNTPNTTYNATGLAASTLYTFTVRAKDAAGNTSNSSAGVTITTNVAGVTTELFFSEYVEGSSFNKALEVANFTGSSVNLSSYSIKKQTNGAGSWSAGYPLSGTLTNENVFVLAHSSADAAVIAQADATTTNSSITFNGNDAVGLFKNDVLIDIIGVFGSSATFGQDVTLRRKAEITNPNTTYTTSEWDSYASNTFSDLGTHTVNGGTTPDTEAPTIPTNIIASNIGETTATLNWTASTDNVGVSAYDVYQDGTLIGSTAFTNYNVSGLTIFNTYTFTVRAKDAAGNTSATSAGTNVTTVDTTAPTVPTNVIASNETQTTIDLSWTASTDNVGVTSYEIYSSGALVTATTSTSYQVTGLSPNTAYSFTVSAVDAAGNTSATSTAATTSTTFDPVTGEADLFFSEYIEGSSFNKALEIANFTGAPVDLSIYSIKKQTNGAGDWASPYNLSGVLANGDVFVIANSSANASILNQADVSTGSGIVTFNGNDPIGLFKNDVLIDVIGTFNGGSANFAIDVTLRRIASVTSPNTNYTEPEWDVFATDTSSNLGAHAVDGGGNTGGTGGSTTVLHEGFFETGLDGWVDGGGDCARYTGSLSYEGSYSIRLRDDSGTASSMTLNDIDVSPYDEVEIDFYFYANSMETGEDFWVRYHDGTNWQTVRTYASGTDFENGSFYNAKVTLNSTNYSFVNNAKFRFQCDASANADQIYIDQVTITGIVNASARMITQSSKVTTRELSAVATTDELEMEEDFTMYPNPTSNQLEIRIYADASAKYQIHSLVGQIVKEGTLNTKIIDVSTLKAGMYILQINDGDEILTKQFVKE